MILVQDHTNLKHLSYLITLSYKFSLIDLGENVEETFASIGEEIYNRVQLGEYSIHDGWDGVKAGYRRAGRDYGLVEADPARTNCC